MGTVARIYCLLLLVISFCFFLHVSLAAHHGKNKLPSAMVVGTVYCDTCFHKEFSKPSQSIAGASVAVECGDGATKLGFRKEVKTNRRGEFGVRLPLEIGKHIKLIESCSVKLIRSNEPFCSIASSATSAGLRLKSRRNGVPVYSAGFFTFRPLKQPELCYQKPVLGGQKLEQSEFFFPPVPFVPSPPNIGGIPLPPNPFQPPPSLLPPVFPQPPPSLLPPLVPQPPPSLLPPGFPQPPPSLLPPLVPQPPPSLLPPVVPTLPPFPFLNPPPPPPPPAFHFPPIPFPPNPLFPGIPPAKPSKKTSP